MNSQPKSIVAHLISEYLITNHAYIYDQLLGHEDRFRIVVISRCLFPGRENFPFEPIHALLRWHRLYPRLNKYAPQLADWAADQYFNFWIRREKVDLLHAHFGSFGAKLVDLKRSVGLPMVVSFYGDDASSYPQRPEWRDGYQQMFREAEGFIAICDDMKRRLVGFGCPAEKIYIVHVAIDLDKYTYKERQPSKTVKFLIVATFNEKKGHEVLLRAFAKVCARKENVSLTVIGFGPLKGKIKKTIDDLGISDCVDLIDTTNHPDFFSLFVENLHEKDIFVHPSLTTPSGDAEGTPTVIMAASACGMPVISTWHAGIPEVVIDGKTGFLVPEKDVDGLSEKMLYLAEHPELWNELGRAGRKHIEKEFSRAALAQNLKIVYNNILEKSERTVIGGAK